MQLKILGSSSAGNCYVLETDIEALVIECGVLFMDVKKAVDFNISKIKGALCSHSHKDHSKFINDFLNARIGVYISEQTKKEIELKCLLQPTIIKENEQFMIGNFTVLPFLVKHDVECFGFLIHHQECGKLLFVTDSYYVPYTFSGLNNLLIEANYSLEILMKNVSDGRMHGAMLNRTLQSHMSIETCCEALAANDLSKVNNIVLIHLSAANSNADEFQRRIERQTGKKTTIADKGMVIKNFNVTPF